MRRRIVSFLRDVFIVFVLLQFQKADNEPLCPLNSWFHTSDVLLNESEYEYKFIVVQKSMTWFEALDVCRREGRGAELFSFDSIEELIRLSKKLSNCTIFRDNRAFNAHYHLYADVPAWSNGVPLRDAFGIKIIYDREYGEWIASENAFIRCTNSASNFDHCLLYGGHFGSCTSAFTNTAFCMRPLQTKRTTRDAKFEFISSEWIQRPNKSDLFYRILENDNCRFKSQWYCARLRCLDYNASLIDIEDETEFDWLKVLIANEFKNQLQLFDKYKNKLPEFINDIYYYIDLHRYLYDPRDWTFGGPPKQRSFHFNLSRDVHPVPCKQELCAAIEYNRDRYGAGNFTIRSIRCVGEYSYGRTICKKRVHFSTNTSNRQSQPFFLVSVSLCSLLLIASSLFCCYVLFSLRHHVKSSNNVYENAVSYRTESEPYATVVSSNFSREYETPAPAATNASLNEELHTYETAAEGIYE